MGIIESRSLWENAGSVVVAFQEPMEERGWLCMG